ncbi:unnamed protein product [Effrenium voratum]|nr:unnamed protein product [Effrenium voratum]
MERAQVSAASVGSMTSMGTLRTRASYVTACSELSSSPRNDEGYAEVKEEFLEAISGIEEVPNEHSWLDALQEVALDRRAQRTAAAALGGYLTAGVAGGSSGLFAGGSLGLLLGLTAMPFTFGLSLPVGVAVGGCTGLCVGASLGAGFGLAGGALLGRQIFYRQLPAPGISSCEAPVESPQVSGDFSPSRGVS